MPTESATLVSRSTGACTFTLKVTDRISDLHPSEWDSVLTPDDLQATHRFISACESAGVEQAQFRHLLFTDDRGSAAIATLSAFSVRWDLLAPSWVRSVTRRLPRMARLPLVICGLPVSFNQSCLRFRSDVDPGEILPHLHQQALALARQTGARILCAKEFSTEEGACVSSAFEALGYRVAPSLPTCTLPLPYPSFLAYRDAMRSSYRRQLATSRRNLEHFRLRIRSAPLEENLERIVPLYHQVMDHAEYKMERLEAPFFEELAALDETHTILLEDAAGSLVCVAILLRGSEVATFLLTGIDYARARPVRGYETLVTAVVEQALEWGAASLELGQTSWALKTRLGAQVRPRSLYLCATGPVLRALLPSLLPRGFPLRNFPSRCVFREPPARSPVGAEGGGGR